MPVRAQLPALCHHAHPGQSNHEMSGTGEFTGLGDGGSSEDGEECRLGFGHSQTNGHMVRILVIAVVLDVTHDFFPVPAQSGGETLIASAADRMARPPSTVQTAPVT